MFDATQVSTAHTAELADNVHAKLKHLALIGNFPPRRCGIATFTEDLFRAIAGAAPNLHWDIVAMDDCPESYAYDRAVTGRIAQARREAYADAARRLNQDRVEVASIQHEFGIFGGPAGENVLTLVNDLRCPVVTTLHTVLEAPDRDQRRVMEALIARSTRLVVMSQKGRAILRDIYRAPLRKIDVIPHGAPDRPLADTAPFKRRFGFEGRRVALTFGLLSPSKGIESVIRALPRLVRERPDVLYVVLGATHPHLVAQQGETYREQLEQLARDLGVADNVRFINAYVDQPLLLDYLAAADVYVTPYLNKAQITSGTLAYAVALGKPVISTPYWHAEELLADGAGVLTPFGDVDAIARELSALLSDDVRRRALSKRAYARGRESVWSRVGALYLQSFEAARTEWRPQARRFRAPALPALSLNAVDRLSDACGILQHARFAVPDRNHGYCLDDNARALILTQRLEAIRPRGAAQRRLAYVYAAFVEHAWNEADGCFRNFMHYDRTWAEQRGSADSSGRGLWSIGETAERAVDPELKGWALHLGARVTAHARALEPLRAKAFAILGFCGLARAGDPVARDAIEPFAQALHAALLQERRPDWRWFEPTLGYDNARLPEALLRAGLLLDNADWRDAALDALDWLTRLHTSPSQHFRGVGSQSFGRAYAPPSRFDQQPIEAAAAIDACWTAFEASGDEAWAREAHRAFAWFMGENDLGVRLADTDRGGCFDGLGAAGPNRNQGAESVLSYQLALCAMRSRERQLRSSSVR